MAQKNTALLHKLADQLAALHGAIDLDMRGARQQARRRWRGVPLDLGIGYFPMAFSSSVLRT